MPGGGICKGACGSLPSLIQRMRDAVSQQHDIQGLMQVSLHLTEQTMYLLWCKSKGR